MASLSFIRTIFSCLSVGALGLLAACTDSGGGAATTAGAGAVNAAGAASLAGNGAAGTGVAGTTGTAGAAGMSAVAAGSGTAGVAAAGVGAAGMGAAGAGAAGMGTAGAGAAGTGAAGTVDMGPAPGTYSAVWENVIVAVGCGSGALCHAGDAAGKLRMVDKQMTYDALVNQPAMGMSMMGANCADSGLMRVKPMDPDNSLLVQKLEAKQMCGMPMPPAGNLDADLIMQVKMWIQNGAPND